MHNTSKKKYMKSVLMMTAVFLLMLQASETRAAILECVRTAKHPDFTRIAFEFQNPAQFKEPVIDGKGKFTVVFPNSTTVLPKQSIYKKTRIQTIRSIELIQKGTLLTASIELPFPYFKLKVFSLSSPDRVVIDAYSITPPTQEIVPDKSLDAKAALKESSPLPSNSNNYHLQIYMLGLLNFLIIIIILLLSINLLKKKSGINSEHQGKISESLKPIDERIAAINAMINKKFEKNDET